MSPEEKHNDERYEDHLLPQRSAAEEGYSTTAYSSISLKALSHRTKNESYDTNTAFHPSTTSQQQSRTSRILITVFLVLLSLCMVTQRFWRLRRPLENNATIDGSIVNFDYIVVGAGPAGLLVASELARARPDLMILLLESGSTSQTSVLRQLWKRQRQQNNEAVSTVTCDANAMMDMRLQRSSTFFNEFDIPLLWSGAAASHKHHWGIELLGKAVGGSAIHNAMLYVRSLASDWDNIPGWDFETIQDEYVSLETYWGDDDIPTTRRTGHGGRLTTSSPVIHDAIAPLFVRAASHAGYKVVNGFNEYTTSRSGTVGYYEFNIKDGVRDSVAAAVLGNGIPDNLIIETDATVTRVLLGLHKNAIGVEYVQGRTIGQFLLAKGGEVILSAGAILTPQLLHNSGFNFTYTVKDHPVVTVGFNVDAEMAADEAQSSLYLVGHELNEYHSAVEQLSQRNATRNATETALLHHQLGAFGTPGFTGGAFLRSPWADATDAPDIQLTVFPQQMEPHVMRELKQGKKSPAMLVTIALLQPDAYYEVLPSQSDQPLIESSDRQPNDLDHRQAIEWKRIHSYRLPKLRIPNNGSKEEYLSDRDAKRLAWGIQQVRKIQQTEPLSLHTGPEVYPATVDLLTHVRKNHLTNSHWVNSTPLGSAMVDERLRVSENVRIVDAGVLPMVPNGNIHSTVCVVASRAAKLILEDRDRNGVV